MAATGNKLKRIFDADGKVAEKECRKCSMVKAIEHFYTNGKITQNNIDGHSNTCIECRKAEWRKQAEDPEKRKQWLLMRIKSKCTTQGIPFNLTLDDLVIPTHCPILGIPLKFGSKQPNNFRDVRGRDYQAVPDDSPSIDRIEPHKGYVKGNVVVVSYRANNIKTNASVDELIKVANFYKVLTSKA